MRIIFWGTRGSIPAPGPHTVRVGGNTTCLEVETGGDSRIIVDAGTGMRPLGLRLIREHSTEPITLLLTHSHWDHLAGFTFFPPAYSADFSMLLYGNPMALEVIRRDIFERRDNRYFPVNMDDFRASIHFQEPIPKPMIAGEVKIDTINLNHPGNGYGYRFEQHGKRLAFITDNEIGLQYQGGNSLEELRDFCSGCDVLVHDAQYLPSEIAAHHGWGHSTYEEVADLAAEAGVAHILLTHHDPERDDDGCQILLERARQYIANRGYHIFCELAIEGQSLVL
jgi:phosphoribosyl 1,2-cyclic phosphodiesterase